MAEVYPNAPLVETIFEIRFPPVLAINSLRHEFQEAVKAEFPVVQFPVIQAGEAPGLSPYTFVSSDGGRRLMISASAVAYSSAIYPDFQTFKGEALDYLGSIVKRYGITDLIRTGLRYTNFLPFVREDGLVPLARYFNLNLPYGGFSHFELRTVVRQERGNLLVRIEQSSFSEGTQELFLLDFDYVKSESLAATFLSEYLDESHDRTKYFFEHLITEEYRQVMRGEIIT